MQYGRYCRHECRQTNMVVLHFIICLLESFRRTNRIWRYISLYEQISLTELLVKLALSLYYSLWRFENGMTFVHDDQSFGLIRRFMMGI